MVRTGLLTPSLRSVRALPRLFTSLPELSNLYLRVRYRCFRVPKLEEPVGNPVGYIKNPERYVLYPAGYIKNPERYIFYPNRPILYPGTPISNCDATLLNNDIFICSLYRVKIKFHHCILSINYKKNHS